ncbi:MAG TPA: hypothetical protein VHU61_09565 [Solirubrobacteraceae bacterium]|jgi:hypothetical protein|nr:hypothetical protein [Solirubrobacteraceae bacterium]
MTRQQVAGGDRGLELLGIEPAALLDEAAAHQCDVRGRPAEPDHADSAPLAQHRRERDR